MKDYVYYMPSLCQLPAFTYNLIVQPTFKTVDSGFRFTGERPKAQRS